MRKKIKILLAGLLICSILGGCSMKELKVQKKYQATFFDLFDTVTTVVGYAESQEEFEQVTEQLKAELLEYHQLFDIYEEYEGINNLKTMNDQAGKNPVPVTEKLLDFLLFCQEINEKTQGHVNAALGSVLCLWHEARSEAAADPQHAKVPDWESLSLAGEHCDFSQILIDREQGTVRILDPKLQLDVGALGKGYALEKVCENMPKGYLISVGGNVRSTGEKPEGDGRWIIGIQDPDGKTNENIYKVAIEELSVVTSGDYQRYYTVDGVVYHHIIDPDTLYPSVYWSSVTVLCEDSGIADGLSTALFTMDQEEGSKLLEIFDAEAVWIDPEGNSYFSSGMSDYLVD